MHGDREPLWRRIASAGTGILNPRSIKGKISLVFSVAFLSIAALTALNLWNLSTLKERMLLGERYDDLLNNILEVRRFEKNFLIYGDHRSLQESKSYLERIDTLVHDLASDLPRLIGERAFHSFQANLRAYREVIEPLADGDWASPDPLRTLGKVLTDDADHFREIKRKRIHAAILRTSTLPFAFFAILISLMFLVVWLIFHGLLRPLDVVMETTRLVGRGDFSPIQYEGIRLKEISGLIEAINRMAQELEARQEDLIQTRKIAAIGTFTAGIAHELNNPINNIALTAESLKEEFEGKMEADSMEMLNDILGQAERAADIVKNLLDFSRTEKPVFSELAPDQILTSTINLVKNQFKVVGLQFETSVAKNLPSIRGNLGNLQQVFTNLLLNAIQATPQGEKISMRVELAPTPGYISFAIRDSGAGIPPEIQHKIFEPFFSTKEVGKGTGLGLAVSYAIVKRHGGRIEVTSEPGEGATFTVFLPYVAEAEAQPEEFPWGM